MKAYQQRALVSIAATTYFFGFRTAPTGLSGTLSLPKTPPVALLLDTGLIFGTATEEGPTDFLSLPVVLCGRIGPLASTP